MAGQGAEFSALLDLQGAYSLGKGWTAGSTRCLKTIAWRKPNP